MSTRMALLRGYRLLYMFCQLLILQGPWSAGSYTLRAHASQGPYRAVSRPEGITKHEPTQIYGNPMAVLAATFKGKERLSVSGTRLYCHE